MQSLKLTLFEIKKQITSISFIIITAIFIIFAITQMGEIFHYPVRNNQDSTYLKEHGENDYLYVNASLEELRTNTIDYLNRIISQDQMKKEDANVIKNLITKMEQENLSFDQAYKILSKENPDLIPCLDVCKSQFGHKVGTIDEINQNMKITLDGKEYSTIFFEKYVTYMQLICAMLILPLFMLLFTKDVRHNMNEIISIQPISAIRYILCRYIGCLLPVLLIVYILGLAMNFYIIHRFQTAGWQINYEFFFKDYMTFIVPTILFLSSLIMFLVLFLKKSIAVFPLYIFYVIFNATQSAFLGRNQANSLYKCVIRLDNIIPYNNFILLNRGLYLVLSVILIIISCILYKYSRNNPRRAVTL
ncbi:MULTISPECIES: hypothetical protein [unclassified Clostridium]|uniref:hypothetical protein n=1 Tax=unclassified Clostridium TaxID=2614128 RepID=UPI0020796BB1|nr:MULTISPECIES: hypothetical protein [unclassified Clostridium]